MMMFGFTVNGHMETAIFKSKNQIADGFCDHNFI